MSVAPRGASVAFELIDGPPQNQFYRLVQDLNDEAQTRRLAVVSRERQAAYRVRGYLAAETAKGKTSISWVWDVFDGDGRRALRITGAEPAAGRHHDAWDAADDAILRHIASASMDQIGAFLTQPGVAPAQPAPSTVAFIDQDYSPEAAGIFRIFHADADPAPGTAAETPTEQAPLLEDVPLPRRRPTISAANRLRETVAVAVAH